MKTGTKEEAEGLYNKVTSKIREFSGKMGDISELGTKATGEKPAARNQQDTDDPCSVSDNQ